MYLVDDFKNVKVCFVEESLSLFFIVREVKSRFIGEDFKELGFGFLVRKF